MAQPLRQELDQLHGRHAPDSELEAACARRSRDEVNRTCVTAVKEANTDHATGAFNLRFFDNDSERRHREVDTKEGYCLLYADMDGMKRMNDLDGHTATTNVLKEVVVAIRKELRAGDSVARLHGDEFVITLVNVSRKDAAHVARRIVKRIERSVVLPHSGPVSLRIGVAEMRRHESLAALVARADKALSRAKKSRYHVIMAR